MEVVNAAAPKLLVHFPLFNHLFLLLSQARDCLRNRILNYFQILTQVLDPLKGDAKCSMRRGHNCTSPARPVHTLDPRMSGRPCAPPARPACMARRHVRFWDFACIVSAQDGITLGACVVDWWWCTCTCTCTCMLLHDIRFHSIIRALFIQLRQLWYVKETTFSSRSNLENTDREYQV